MDTTAHPLRVVFQGDSITDCGRSNVFGEDMGNGYALMASAWFAAQFPEHPVAFFNRGMNGNRLRDLCARWQADCLDLRPQWVSLLAGINDTQRRYDRSDPTSLESFTASYRQILDATLEAGAHIVLCEPFLLVVRPEQAAWRDDLDPKIAAVRELAATYRTPLIPLDRLLTEAATKRPPSFWSDDGVHPTAPGHALIARAWLDTMSAALLAE